MANIFDLWGQHATASEEMKLGNVPDYHQKTGYNFAQNFPAMAESGIGAGLLKGYQYGQELGRWGLGELGFGKNIDLSDAWKTAKEQSDLNILGFGGQGFDMDEYNQWMNIHGYTPPRRGTVVPFMRDRRATQQGLAKIAMQKKIQAAESAAAQQESLQAQVTAQANREARERVGRGEARDYGHTQTRESSGWQSDPMRKGGIASLKKGGRIGYQDGTDKGELVDEVNGLMEKTPFFTQEDYDKVKYKDPKGTYATENWGKGQAPLAEVTEDDEIISYMGKFVEGETEKNLDKAKTLAHEKLHILWEDPEVRATAPPWMQEQFRKGDELWEKYEEAFDAGDDKKADAYYDAWEKLTSGIALDPDKPATGGGDVMGEELYTRFIENKYFPKTESDVGPWGDRVYFDKILKEHWDPYAEKFDKLMKSREVNGGIANHFRKK